MKSCAIVAEDTGWTWTESKSDLDLTDTRLGRILANGGCNVYLPTVKPQSDPRVEGNQESVIIGTRSILLDSTEIDMHLAANGKGKSRKLAAPESSPCRGAATHPLTGHMIDPLFVHLVTPELRPLRSASLTTSLVMQFGRHWQSLLNRFRTSITPAYADGLRNVLAACCTPPAEATPYQ